MSKRFTHVVGIDEVGRGPIAGPVAVGAVLIPLSEHRNEPMAKAEYRQVLSTLKIRDSKKLSPQKRNELLSQASVLQKEGRIKFTVSFIGAQVIDDIGIATSIFQALGECLETFNIHPEKTLVLLDGALKAPKQYRFQQTIIKGDEKEYVIGLASVIAKVARDTVMENYALLYPEYNFDAHKGYGTHDHYKMVRKHGLTPLHRKSFLKQFVALVDSEV